MRRISCQADIDEGVAALVAADPRLEAVVETAGAVPLRLNEPGLQGLCRIVVSQQLSVASAGAIWGRFAALVGHFDAAHILAHEPEELKGCGLSAPKIRTIHAVAAAERDGLGLESLAARPAEEAHQALVAIKGIGPWTADIYLLFCGGHPDIFPVGDIALQAAVGMAFDIDPRPPAADLAEIATPWSPWRGVAARLFWAYYGARKRKVDVLPV